MTVGQLIERLKAFESEQRIIMPGEDWDVTYVHEAHLDLSVMVGGQLNMSDERDADRFWAVRLFGAPGR